MNPSEQRVPKSASYARGSDKANRKSRVKKSKRMLVVGRVAQAAPHDENTAAAMGKLLWNRQPLEKGTCTAVGFQEQKGYSLQTEARTASCSRQDETS